LQSANHSGISEILFPCASNLFNSESGEMASGIVVNSLAPIFKNCKHVLFPIVVGRPTSLFFCCLSLIPLLSLSLPPPTNFHYSLGAVLLFSSLYPFSSSLPLPSILFLHLGHSLVIPSSLPRPSLVPCPSLFLVPPPYIQGQSHQTR
jgi:hypothetical protein